MLSAINMEKCDIKFNWIKIYLFGKVTFKSEVVLEENRTAFPYSSNISQSVL